MEGTVEERVIGIVAEQLQIDKTEITLEKSFVKDLGADSLDRMEVVMKIEEVFVFLVPEEDAEKITTVGDAIDYVEAHASKTASKSV